jgi:hypothetical protein
MPIFLLHDSHTLVTEISKQNNVKKKKKRKFSYKLNYANNQIVDTSFSAYNLGKCLAFPQNNTLAGTLVSVNRLCSLFHTLRYNSCPKYLLSQIADLKFHMPLLSNDTNMAVQEFGYTYLFMHEEKL